jgi:hypothetical protein
MVGLHAFRVAWSSGRRNKNDPELLGKREEHVRKTLIPAGAHHPKYKPKVSLTENSL